MPKKIPGSNVKDPDNHSKKDCVCGGHSNKAKNAKPKHKKVEHKKLST